VISYIFLVILIFYCANSATLFHAVAYTENFHGVFH